MGEVRQGALEGVLTAAVARAAAIDSGKVRRAALMAGDLGVVAQAALRDVVDRLGEPPNNSD